MMKKEISLIGDDCWVGLMYYRQRGVFGGNFALTQRERSMVFGVIDWVGRESKDFTAELIF